MRPVRLEGRAVLSLHRRRTDYPEIWRSSATRTISRWDLALCGAGGAHIVLNRGRVLDTTAICDVRFLGDAHP